MTGSKETLITEQEAKDALREALEGRSALIVVDDVWTIDHADTFSVTASPTRLFITTRNNEVLVGVGAEELSRNVVVRASLSSSNLVPKQRSARSSIFVCFWARRFMFACRYALYVCLRQPVL
jgi:hypothetical protein